MDKEEEEEEIKLKNELNFPNSHRKLARTLSDNGLSNPKISCICQIVGDKSDTNDKTKTKKGNEKSSASEETCKATLLFNEDFSATRKYQQLRQANDIGQYRTTHGRKGSVLNVNHQKEVCTKSHRPLSRQRQQSRMPCTPNQFYDNDSWQRLKALNIDQFVGQSLFIQKRQIPNTTEKCPQLSLLRQQAKFVTGIPLIKSGPNHGPVKLLRTNPNMVVGQVVPIPILRYTYNQLQTNTMEHNVMPSRQVHQRNPDKSSNRILKPRRKRKQNCKIARRDEVNHSRKGNSQGHEDQFEYVDELHLLPTDLLNDDSRLSDESSGSKSPPQSRPPLRHCESMHQMATSAKVDSIPHPQLRKTFSWNTTAPGDPREFSLFPQTSQMDLFDSVRNNWVNDGGRKRSDLQLSANIEETLKNLHIDNNDASLSRKF